MYKHCWIFDQAPHIETELNSDEVSALFERGGVMVRNVFDFDRKEPTEFWYVIKDSFGGMEELVSKNRTFIRKSLKTYDFRIVDKQEVLKYGYPIYLKALERYKVKTISQTREEFGRWIESCTERSEFWMIFSKETGEAVGYSINTLHEGCAEYNQIKVNPGFLGNTYPFYGLFYEMNRHYLEEKKLRYVIDGARSLTEHSHIQTFLTDKFNFRKAYCGVRIYYKQPFKTALMLLYPFRRFFRDQRFVGIFKMEEIRREFAKQDAVKPA
ncbi:MAG: hypothetical protein NC324_08755 [Bacteroides sp.]|nr:hypothetical protein [Bacteroides sp.]